MPSTRTIKIYTLILFILFFSLFVYLFYNNFEDVFGFSLFAAFGINILNVAIWMVSLKRGMNKPNKIFLKWIFGGMIIRFSVLLPAIYISIKFLNISTTSFILAFLINYIITLSFEIYTLATFKVIKNN